MSMTHLIDKDALVAEIEKLRDAALTRQHNLERIGQVSSINEQVAFNLNKVLSFIDTLEVKEVDIEKEVDEMWNYVFSEFGWDENNRMTITHKEFMALTKHFFELGLKAKG